MASVLPGIAQCPLAGLYEAPSRVWVARTGAFYSCYGISYNAYFVCAWSSESQAVHHLTMWQKIGSFEVEEVSLDEALDVAKQKHAELECIKGVIIDADPAKVIYVA